MCNVTKLKIGYVTGKYWSRLNNTESKNAKYGLCNSMMELQIKFVLLLHPYKASTFWTDKDFIKFTFNVRGNNWKQTCCIPFCTHFTAFHSVIVSRNQSSEWMSDNHKVVIVFRNKLKFFRWLWCHPVHCFVWKIFFNVNTIIF